MLAGRFCVYGHPTTGGATTGDDVTRREPDATRRDREPTTGEPARDGREPTRVEPTSRRHGELTSRVPTADER